MENKMILINNIERIHTTELGLDRIHNNIDVDTNKVIHYCKKIVLDENSIITKKGKNWYVMNENIIVTINSYSYTVITAHKKVDL